MSEIMAHDADFGVLSDDVARCAGVCTARDWMDQCKTCARRLSPPNNRERVVYMAPPLMVFDHCKSYLSHCVAPKHDDT
jgi:hypothetical protein